MCYRTIPPLRVRHQKKIRTIPKPKPARRRGAFCGKAGRKFSRDSHAILGRALSWFCILLRIGGEYAELERWFYQGIGSTTYYTPTAFRPPPAKSGDKGAAGGGKQIAVAQPRKGGGWILWSQRDLHGILGLTDREKLRLRQR